MNDKIRREHLQRTAYVYVRQSTPQQVRHHLESKERQYGLADRARQLGFSTVTVIDEDLGRSGGGTQERPGFGRLLAFVCQGLAGAVFALEASRLARNNRDWHHLVDLCALAETLLIDSDGIYDPRQLNDRLVLGLKGTMSEFELNLMRQRAREAFEQKVRRGFAMWELPVGFVRNEENGIEKTPDRQVQQAVTTVFQKFRQLGSARQATIWFREEQIPVPHVKPGTAGNEIVWALPSSGRLLQMLRNPCYAGAFAYGKTAGRTVIEQGRARQGTRYRKPKSEWKVLITDHHSGYISWEEYVQNQQQIDANAMCGDGEGSGAARTGAALLSGLLRCGQCGRKLQVVYSGNKGRVPRYICRGDRGDRGHARCQTVGSLRLDRAIVRCVLDAIQPVGIEAAINVAASTRAEDDARTASLELALERARYEANRARRQFDAVDPENRLVASELETRWNRALAQVSELEHRLAEAKDTADPITSHTKAELMTLCDQLPAVWEHPDAPVQLKKRILRTVLNDIIIKPEQALSMYRVCLHWAGGVHTEFTIARNKTGQHGRSADRDVIELIAELAKVCPDKSAAAILNRLGYKTGQGNSWNASRVAGLRGYHEIPTFQQQHDWVTQEQAARELRVSNTVVKRLIHEGILPAKHVVECAPWIIERKDLTLPAVQQQVQNVRRGRKLSKNCAAQQQFALD
jgi:DNA invertase Pin-like site-specific DNA recombinase